MEAVRGHIRAFKAQHGLDKVIVLWTANTERFAAIEEGASARLPHQFGTTFGVEGALPAASASGGLDGP